jgi:3-(3-hydroxy-phenyl)propionate hydroxylase
MNERFEYPAIIVGAGPTGLTLANLLGSYGVETLILERNPATMDIPRAIVLDDEGARTLQAFGAEDFLCETIEGDGARYIDDNGQVFATIGAGARTYGFAKRHFMLQPELEQALVRNLEHFPSVDLQFSANMESFRPDPLGVSVEYSHAGTRRTVRTKWLLACDGGRSGIRQTLGIDFEGGTYEQDWAVIDTVRDADQTNYSKFYCNVERPAVSVPAPHGGRRYEFMLQEGEDHERILSDESLAALLQPFRPFVREDILRRVVYTFHARIASKFRLGRVLLLGDAAHLTPPFAGQGMNAGLRDAHNVAWKIAAVISGMAGESLLDTYQLERRDPAWAMIQLAVAMGQVVMPKGAEQVQFRNLLLKALEPFPGVRDYFLQMRFKPKPRYDTGFFVNIDAQRYEASLVGEMLPQPEVHRADGAQTKLDDLLGRGFALIAQDAAGERAILGLRHPVWNDLKPQLVSLARRGTAEKATLRRAALVDSEISRPLLTHRDQILLIRPDRYVCGAFSHGEETAFGDAVARLLSAEQVWRLSA